jgi:hypothetical protein
VSLLQGHLSHTKRTYFFYFSSKQEATEGVVDLADEDADFVDAMLRFLYTLDYASTGMVSSGNRLNTVLNAVKMYGVADRFDIAKLREAAKLHVASSPLSEEFEDDRLACIVDTVYSTTPSSDRGLRDVVALAASHDLKKRIRTPAFAALLEMADGFAADLAQLLASRQPHGVVKRYKCPDCSKIWEGTVEPNQTISCMYCQSGRSDWHSYIQEHEED